MGRIHLHCVCGSFIELRSWPSPEANVDAWYKVHNLCAIAWQRERGLKSTISYPDQETEE
jgi:hypothetical protein